MRNQLSSSGLSEDLIRAFVQVGCAETHAKTILEKVNAELENGILTDQDDIEEAVLHIDDLVKEISLLAELRRNMMRTLQSMYPDGDKSYWCMVKHLGLAMFAAFEVYQASDDDPDLLNMALETNARFTHALSRFLGTEITSCAACFHDMMREKITGGRYEL